jgi:hypothetical protein
MTTYQANEEISQQISAERYVEAFEEWMDDWQPDVFVTINLPNGSNPKQQIRSHEFNLGLWTRISECNLTNLRHVAHGDGKERMVWIFRGEVSPDGLIHY